MSAEEAASLPGPRQVGGRFRAAAGARLSRPSGRGGCRQVSNAGEQSDDGCASEGVGGFGEAVLLVPAAAGEVARIESGSPAMGRSRRRGEVGRGSKLNSTPNSGSVDGDKAQMLGAEGARRSMAVGSRTG